MKPRLRYTLINLLSAVTLVGGAIGVYRTFWEPGRENWQNCWFLLGIYIAVVSVFTCKMFLSLPRPPGFVLGFTIFGWAYLAFVLHFGFGVTGEGGTYLEPAETLAKNSQLGLALAFLTGLARRSGNHGNRPDTG